MTAWAQDYLGKGLAEAQSPPSPEGFSLLSSLMSAAGALLLVLALIYALFFILRRWGMSRGWVLPPADRALKVLASRSLDGRKTLYLMQVGGSLLVLGGGSSELRLLHSIQDPKEVERVRSELGLAPGEGGEGAFEGALSSAFDKEDRDRSLREGNESIQRARKSLRKVWDRLGGKGKE